MINPVRLDATVVTGTALETMAKYQVVKFSDFGQLNLATYDDLQTSTIVNPDWNWSTVGAPLWVANDGTLTETDPHVP